MAVSIVCQSRRTSVELLAAATDLRASAGAFRYLRESFVNSPSLDMQAFVVDTLIELLLTQARECLFERTLLDENIQHVTQYIERAQEATLVRVNSRVLAYLFVCLLIT